MVIESETIHPKKRTPRWQARRSGYSNYTAKEENDNPKPEQNCPRTDGGNLRSCVSWQTQKYSFKTATS
jgi:hypothetical protein